MIPDRFPLHDTPESCEAPLAPMVANIGKSRVGKALLLWAQENNISVAIAANEDAVSGKTIFLSPSTSPEKATLELIGGIRRIWQERLSILPGADFSPEDNILIRRARMADIATITTQVAHEMASAGVPACLAAWEESSCGDLSRAFKTAANADGKAISWGHAARQTYDQWFRDPERLARCDSSTCGNMETTAAAFQRHAAQGFWPLRELDLSELGAIPPVGNYLLRTATFRPEAHDATGSAYRGSMSSENLQRLAALNLRIASPPPAFPRPPKGPSP